MIDIKNNIDSDFIAIYSDNEDALSGRVTLVEKNIPEPLGKHTLDVNELPQRRLRNHNQINIIPSNDTIGGRESYGISSPSDAGIIQGMKYNLRDSIKSPITEALNEKSEL